MNCTDSPMPGPEEIQKKLSEFMKKEFGDRVVLSATHTETAEHPSSPSEEPPRKEIDFEFNFKPKEVKAHLDRFVIKQDDAKKVLSIAVCDHYNHVKSCERGEEIPDYSKQNVLLIGPTGVGKSYLIRVIADLIGVPFVKADATKFTETGYVGGDAEDLVRELVHKADGDIELAQYGIIYLDEVDKIASPANIIGRDVSGRGVQTNLLKLMEETEVQLRSPTDVQAQLQAAFEFSRKGKIKQESINTKNILFIVSGAFDQMVAIVRKRIRQSNIGFGKQTNTSISEADILRQTRTDDLVQFGFEPEFVGRLPVRVVLDKLSVDDLHDVLRLSEGSTVNQYEASFRAFGIDVISSDDGLRAIAEKAALENTGARGLLTVCEQTLREFKYELPSSQVRQFVVTRALVNDPKAELDRILNECDTEQHELMKQFVREFEIKFNENHGFTIRFDKKATDKIIERAVKGKKSVLIMCRELFKDYQFGLNLIKENTGKTEFTLTASAISDPGKFISNLVAASYQKK